MNNRGQWQLLLSGILGAGAFWVFIKWVLGVGTVSWLSSIDTTKLVIVIGSIIFFTYFFKRMF